MCIAGCVKRSTKRGRPREQFTAAARKAFITDLNTDKLEDLGSHSTKQCWWKASCNNPDHIRYLTCHWVSENPSSLQCRVCNKHGSSHEKEAYTVMASSKHVGQFATEAFVLKGEYEHNIDGVTTAANLTRHPWDVVTAPPLKMLVEVQGEHHTTELNTQAHSSDEDLASKYSTDLALAEAALAQGYSVVWLQCEPLQGRSRRWAVQLKQAAADAVAGKQPQLYRG